MNILFSKTSLTYIKALDKKTKDRIIKAIDKLPDKGDIVKILGKKIKNIFRLRVGKYRIIFHVEEDQIKILDVDGRGDIYKQSLL